MNISFNEWLLVSFKDGFTAPVNYYRNLLTSLRSVTEASKIKIPVLIIWGKDDVALTSELATLASDQCDNCIVKYVDGASHWVQQDSPTIVNEYIIKFIKTSA